MDGGRIIGCQVTPHTACEVVQKSGLEVGLVETTAEADNDDEDSDANHREYLERLWKNLNGEGHAQTNKSNNDE
jgi:hypothetical protein